MTPMTAEELQKHPEFNHTVWDLKPAGQGKVAVAKDRGGPINIAYEIHGSGDRHLVVSMLYIWYSHKLRHPASKSGTLCGTICHMHSSESLPEPSVTTPGTFCFRRMDCLTTPILASHAPVSGDSTSPRFYNSPLFQHSRTCSCYLYPPLNMHLGVLQLY